MSVMAAGTRAGRRRTKPKPKQNPKQTPRDTLVARPLGVNLLAALNFVVAAAMAGVGAAMLARGTGVLRSPVAQRVLGVAGARSIWMLVITSVVLGVIMGVGLLMMRDWGRLLMVIYCFIGLVTSGLMLLEQLAHYTLDAVLLRLGLVIIYALILRYLTRPEIKRAFGVPDKSVARGA